MVGRLQSHLLGRLSSSFEVWVDRPPAIKDPKQCKSHGCFKHPEKSECRGLCRHKVENHRIDLAQRKAAGQLRKKPDSKEIEMKMAAAGRDSPPPLLCPWKTCQNLQLPGAMRSSGYLESTRVTGNAEIDTSVGGPSFLLEASPGLARVLLTFAVPKLPRRGQRKELCHFL
eukprot:TRINITY_DN78784_c0_g1_i1.p1 TRINITY_DN78784_c0_g1~~TRINITY_DN78784_c0_g1_i1.p1  ORF type:complete len:171 (-),score=33.58 TRINITY_DN78784_c0_g1_i1:88-600(-)